MIYQKKSTQFCLKCRNQVEKALAASDLQDINNNKLTIRNDQICPKNLEAITLNLKIYPYLLKLKTG